MTAPRPWRRAGQLLSVLLAATPLLVGLAAMELPSSPPGADVALGVGRPPVAVVAVQAHAAGPAGAAHVALRVPSLAVGNASGRPHVLVVRADGEVEQRPVTLGAQGRGWQVVAHGLVVGEQVIVTGLSRVHAGMRVEPRPIALTAGSAAFPA